MTAWRTLGVLAGVLVCAGPSLAQSYSLTETPKTGDCVRYTLDTTVTGALQIPQDGGKVLPIKLAVTAKHDFTQRTLLMKDERIIKVARFYDAADSTMTVGGEANRHELREDRKLVVAQQGEDGFVCYSPAGPLTRDEEELVAQHLDTTHLTGVLPTEKVDIDQKWKLSNATVQSLCLFEGLIAHELFARVIEVKDGAAIVQIEGTASGIELGAKVSVDVKATVRYELLPKRISSVEWTRTDKRDAGPANPPSEITTTTKLTRTVLEAEPKELSDIALVSVPANLELPGAASQIALKDPKGRYQFLHPREWHTVSQTDSYLVMRLLDRGDFVAQATIASWRKAEPGKHLTPEELEQIVTAQVGWELEEIVDRGEIPTDDGNWLFRVTAKGSMGGLKVMQSFYCLASAEGEQLIITFTLKPTNAVKLGTRDVALVNSIEFLKK